MSDTKEPERYACEVREVFSGDDLIVYIELGVENLLKRVRLRLAGVDTPNAVNEKGDSPAGMIRNQVRGLARNRRGVLVVTSKNTNSWVGHLTVESPTGTLDLNAYLIDKGFVFKGKGQ